MAPQPGPMQAALSNLMPMLAKGPFPPGPKVRGVAPPADSSPAREVTAEEAAEWVDNGVVCLRQVVPPAWTEYLRACLDDIFSREDVDSGGLRTDMTASAEALAASGEQVLMDGGMKLGSGPASGRFLSEIDCWWHKGLRHFELAGPLPQVVAATLRSVQLRYYQDHLFMKEAGSVRCCSWKTQRI